MQRPPVLLAAACLAATLVTVAPITAAAPADAASKYVSAKTLLAKLKVQNEDHAHNYNRARSGYDNDYDADNDRCYTRREVLIRHAIHVGRISRSCAIYGGRWKSLYDNNYTNDRNSLEIDHLVALAEAWHSEAYKWSHKK